MTTGGKGMPPGGKGISDIIAARRWLDRRNQATADAGGTSTPGPPGDQPASSREADTALALGSAGRGSVEWLRAAAEGGSVEAMVQLGSTLADRPGQLAEAERWLRRAAEAGDPQGQLHLGRLLLFSGRTSEAEPFLDAAITAAPQLAHVLISDLSLRGATELAVRWLQKAAEAGDADAAMDLARQAIEDGDLQAAERWAEWARKLGHQEAELTLAVVANERGDDDAASLWMSRAAEHGSLLAAASYGLDLAGQGRMDEARPLLERVARADIEKAAEGDPNAMYMMAEAIQQLDNQQATVRAFQLAAQHGSAEAALMVGRYMLYEKRPADALPWLTRPGVSELPDAGLLLGMAQDRAGQQEAAKQTFMAAARAGDARAAHKLGWMYEHEHDLPRAIAWYERAADGGEASAMFNLGLIFAEREPATAERWLRKAAELGHQGAPHELAVIAMRAGRDADMRAWLQRGAEAGDQRSVNSLAELAKLDARRGRRGSRWRRG